MPRLTRLAAVLLLLAPARALAQPATEAEIWRHHRGLTVEAQVGLGSFRGSVRPMLQGSRQALAGPALGVGWWLGRRLAVGVRATSVVHRSFMADYLAVGSVGPSAQYWIAPYAWVGGGAGLGLVHDGKTAAGLALDARIGLAFNHLGRHTFNVSLEVTPVFALGATYSGLALLAGYQFM